MIDDRHDVTIQHVGQDLAPQPRLGSPVGDARVDPARDRPGRRRQSARESRKRSTPGTNGAGPHGSSPRCSPITAPRRSGSCSGVFSPRKYGNVSNAPGWLAPASSSSSPTATVEETLFPTQHRSAGGHATVRQPLAGDGIAVEIETRIEKLLITHGQDVTGSARV